MGAKDVKQGLRPISRSVNVYDRFSGLKLAVDISIVLYRLVYTHRNAVAAGGVDVVVRCVWRRMQKFMSAGIMPLCVFDGACLTGKDVEHLRRRERKCKAVAKALALADEDALLKANVEVSAELVLAVQKHFLINGLVYMVVRLTMALS